jgi:hypothetical protein
LPGDELIPQPIGATTHAITIQRSPREVWPWLAQMGATRGGWYSYDLLDNRGFKSAERVLPEFQHIEIGSVMPGLPGVTEGFLVLKFEVERYLVLGWAAPHAPQLATWAFVLEPDPGGGTRLMVRSRVARGYSFFGMPWPLSKPITLLVHHIMQRKQLLGIARRVEGKVHA